MPRCHFDDSLSWLIETLAAEFGAAAVEAGTVLRDASGRLAFFAGAELTEDVVARASEQVRDRLGPYARPDRVVVKLGAAGSERVRSDLVARVVKVGPLSLRYIDRRAVGADWQVGPGPIQERPPRLAFVSLKGGVGRSTALSVVAAEQARRGRNVLVVDLDLEAPGIGSMLLAEERLPDYGALDYLVETNLAPLGEQDLDALVGTSSLTAGAGLVSVVPVVGMRSLSVPESYLAKLSRAMIEGFAHDGGPMPLREKIAALLRDLEARRAYDLVLVDARAGLAELAAGPILGLGASVLLFGTAQRQTLEGLRFLFAHLRSLVRVDEESPWRALKMVHAKAQAAPTHLAFKDDLWELFSEYLYEEQRGIEGFNFGPDDPAAPHNALPIPFDAAFADWDPAREPSKLVEAYYTRTFGPLLDFVNDSIPWELA